MTTATASPLHPPDHLVRPSVSDARSHQWRWLAAGLTLAFSIPFVLTDLTTINRDLYYGVYIGGVFAFVAAWLGCGVGSPVASLTRNWRSGVALGLVFAAVMVAIVRNEPATARPDGLEFVAALAWRGVLYGLADGVILSAFPILAVFAAFAGRPVLARRRGKVAVGALALGVSLLFTAVYHLGYSDFRGEKLRKPLAGDVVWSLPTLATLSPIGSPIAHVGLHVAAVVHSYETDTFLPPHRASVGSSPADLVARNYRHASATSPMARGRASATLFPHSTLERRKTMKRILVAIDGSASSAEAVRFGVELAAEHEAELVFVHVVPEVDVVPAAVFGMCSAFPHEPSREDRAMLEDAAAVAAEHGVVSTIVLLRGETVDELIRYADSRDVDLIVVGTRGHGAIAGALLGSVSRGILRETKRPVLVVRPAATVPAAVGLGF